jgi:hypothetical protein
MWCFMIFYEFHLPNIWFFNTIMLKTQKTQIKLSVHTVKNRISQMLQNLNLVLKK